MYLQTLFQRFFDLSLGLGYRTIKACYSTSGGPCNINIQSNLDLILYFTGSLCDTDFQALSNWNFELTIDDDGLITDSGKEEFRHIGKRYKARLPDIFDESYEEDQITVRKYLSFSHPARWRYLFH